MLLKCFHLVSERYSSTLYIMEEKEDPVNYAMHLRSHFSPLVYIHELGKSA